MQKKKGIIDAADREASYERLGRRKEGEKIRPRLLHDENRDRQPEGGAEQPALKGKIFKFAPPEKRRGRKRKKRRGLTFTKKGACSRGE